MGWRLGAIVLLVLLAGCLSMDGEDTTSDNQPQNTSDDGLDAWRAFLKEPGDRQAPTIRKAGEDEPTAVVAVIDGGINPFHEAFERAAYREPGSLPIDARNTETDQPPVYVPTGLPEARSTDPGWLNDVVEPGTLYHFGGTNLLFYRTPGTTVPVMAPAQFPTIHGTFVAGLATQGAPVVVVVQSYQTYPDALEWAARQPWIDAISTQYPPECLGGTGTGEACPHAALVGPADDRTNASRVAQATRSAWASGKLVFASGGNAPQAVTPVERVRGPPWVAAVGGADTYRNGATFAASQTIDLVSNFTNEGPHASENDAYYSGTGTSGASPLLAGTVADALATVREGAGHPGSLDEGRLVDTPELSLENADAWAAMNATAVYWNATDHDAMARHPEPDLTRSGSAPVNPLAPWVQMGWGYLGPQHADDLAQAMTTGGAPEKPAGAQAWMDARQAQRRAAWG